MRNRIEKAGAFKSEYNCCQAILAAYCDLVGLEKDTALRIGAGFGMGMAMREVCGVVSAMVMLLGMKNSNGTDKAAGEPGRINADVQRLTNLFRAKNGSVICGELLDMRKDGRAPKSCTELVLEGARILESELFPRKIG